MFTQPAEHEETLTETRRSIHSTPVPTTLSRHEKRKALNYLSSWPLAVVLIGNSTASYTCLLRGMMLTWQPTQSTRYLVERFLHPIPSTH